MRLARITAAALLCLLLAPEANAGTVDFSARILDADDGSIMECIDQSAAPADCKKREVTLGILANRALLAPEPGISADEANKRFQVGMMVYRSSGATLTEGEVDMIKKAILRAYNGSPLLVGRAFPLLNAALVK